MTDPRRGHAESQRCQGGVEPRICPRHRLAGRVLHRGDPQGSRQRGPQGMRARPAGRRRRPHLARTGRPAQGHGAGAAPLGRVLLRALPQELRRPQRPSLVPRILVVFTLPEDERQWLTFTEESLILRRCAYWLSLRGAPPTPNETSQTVRLSRGRTFDLDTLRDLLRKVAREEELMP